MTEKRYIWAINEALHEELARDPNVVVIGEDIGIGGGSFGATRGLLDVFGPQRVKDTPISEAAIVGLAAGAASLGLRPVVEIMFSDFMTLAMDQIVNQIAKLHYMFGGQFRVPVTVRAPGGGGLSAGPQHSQSLEAWFTHIPGLLVVAPSTPADAKGLLKSAIRDDNPVIFLEHKGLYSAKGEVPDEEYTIPFGQALVRREGADVTIVAFSRMVGHALEAADALADEGISAEVIDLRTLNPLDIETVTRSVRKTHRVVIAHEAVTTGGFGAEIAAQVVEYMLPYLDHAPVRVGAAFSPIPFSPTLEQAVLPGVPDVIRAAKKSLWL
jgi:pyruvate dehydrogenase E1 component beta subunit